MNEEMKHYQKKLYTEFVRPFPTEEGQWKLISTGEIVTAVEQEDIQGYPIMAVKIENEGTFYKTDFENEIFVMLDDEGELLA